MIIAEKRPDRSSILGICTANLAYMVKEEAIGKHQAYNIGSYKQAKEFLEGFNHQIYPKVEQKQSALDYRSPNKTQLLKIPPLQDTHHWEQISLDSSNEINISQVDGEIHNTYRRSSSNLSYDLKDCFSHFFFTSSRRLPDIMLHLRNFRYC